MKRKKKHLKKEQIKKKNEKKEGIFRSILCLFYMAFFAIGMQVSFSPETAGKIRYLLLLHDWEIYNISESSITYKKSNWEKIIDHLCIVCSKNIKKKIGYN